MAENEFSLSPSELITKAREARRSAYAPYSQFSVGAAILLRDGSVVMGCNVENASYGLSVCAERSAVFRMIAESKKDIVAIAIAGEPGAPAFPCGACRQVLSEFATGIVVYLEGEQGVQTYTLDELLPHAFTLSDVDASAT